MKLLFSLFSFCAGILIYFALPTEPQIKYPILIAILCAINFFIFYKRAKFIQLVFATMFGFFYSVFFTHAIDIPRTEYTMRDTEIIGVVKNIDYTPDRVRLFVQNNDNDAMYRLSLKPDIGNAKLGDEIKIKATIFPPSPADAPGGFDSARWAYFDGLSATGYITNLSVIQSSQQNNISALREYLHNKMNSHLYDSLVLGYKHTLTDSETNAWKAAGVQHIFSISGFHITLVGGWLFAMFYFVFRAVPYITRRIPARYPAMILAMGGLLFYLFLSGADVATIRAFLTTSLMFVAFTLGRSVFTMRNAALAFFALLVMNPHYLIMPGFQLSFAAIFGLIWFFGKSDYEKKSLLRRAWKWIKIVIYTTIVATIFTMPFIAYHFHAVQIYSLLGNIIFVPIFSFLIMPLTLLGITGAATDIYNWSLNIAQKIETLPYSSLQIPTFSGWILLVMIAGLLCLILIKNKKIKIASVGASIIISVAMILITPRPVFYSTPDNGLIAVRGADGKLYFSKKKSSAHYFAFDTWKQNNYEKIGTENLRLKCRQSLCEIKTKNWSLAYTTRFVPIKNNIERLCSENDFIVSYLRVRSGGKCNAKFLLGGFTIYENGFIKKTISNRWWHN